MEAPVEAEEMTNRGTVSGIQEDVVDQTRTDIEKFDIQSNCDSANNINGIFNKEYENLINRPHHAVPLDVALRLRFWALAVSWTSVVVTTALAVVAFVVSALEKSPALFAFGLSSILDSLSSCVVIWRFQFGEGRLYSTSRERRACFVLGVLFTISASSIVSKAIHAIVTELRPGDDNDILWNIAIVNGVICASLSIAKFAMGLKLESRALITDAYNSLVGALMSFAILASALAYKDNKAVWYFDSVVGLICAVLLLGYAIKLFCDIYHDKSSTPPSD